MAFVGESARHGERGAHVVLGTPEETTYVGVEPEEAGRAGHRGPRLLESGRVGEGMSGA